MKTRRVALIIFYDDKKRILLQDRRGISKRGEEWGYFGGGIDEGETPEQAVVRETKEELQYDLKEHRYVGRYTDEIPAHVIDRHVFIAPLKDSSQLTQIEGKNMQFFTLEEALKLKMVSEGDKEVIRAIAKELDVTISA